MRGDVGYWCGELAVGLGPELLEWLDSFGTDRHVSLGMAALGGSRGVVLAPADPGDGSYRVTNMGPRTGLHYYAKVPVTSVTRWAPDLPRFEMHELEFRANYDGDSVLGWLADDHALPWPHISDCKTYTVAEELAEDIYLRVLSCLRVNAPRLAAPISDRLRGLLTPGLWAAQVARARADFANERRMMPV